MNTKIKNMVLCAMFSSLIAVGAFIRIPVPPVPVTMQMFFVTLSGLILGAKNGAVSALVYMLLGLFGLPVFAEGGGFAYIFNPTFGYIAGFIAGAYITGKITEKQCNPSMKRLVIAAVAGMLTVYSIGMIYCFFILYFYLGNPISLKTLFLSCFLIFVPADTVFCILASVISKRLIPALKLYYNKK